MTSIDAGGQRSTLVNALRRRVERKYATTNQTVADSLSALPLQLLCCIPDVLGRRTCGSSGPDGPPGAREPIAAEVGGAGASKSPAVAGADTGAPTALDEGGIETGELAPILACTSSISV